MIREFHSAARAGFAIAALFGLLVLTPGRAGADVIFDVSLDTSSLVANPAQGPYTLDFTLIGAQGNIVTISDIQFGAGGSAGSPSAATGGASGDLASGVVLESSSAFFSDFFQVFTPGDRLTFRVTATTVFDGVYSPDNFSVSILTGDGLSFPTTDALGSALMSVDLTEAAADSVQTFGADTSQTFADGSPVFAFGPATVTAIPEPSSLALLLVGLGAIGALGRHRAGAPAGDLQSPYCFRLR
ncbi:NF038129 family PEP-CTERM protein [Aquisphaera insulae]|uniref:NF038129 family PEP-CTERM protein n=1 Tax=Aquisphaera insulae TaxID=2712864 RepID=UPI0013ED6166|nr:NF038129 family PEP-CTERM protein [Aquisphaera insulae]